MGHQHNGPPDDIRAAVDQHGPLHACQRIENGSLGAPPRSPKPSTATFLAHGSFSNRSQRSMLASHYGQYVTNGGRMGFNKYLRETVKTKWHYHDVLALMEHISARVSLCLFRGSAQTLCASVPVT